MTTSVHAHSRIGALCKLGLALVLIASDIYVFPASSSALTTGTFGNTTIGDECSIFTNDLKRANKYAVGVTATVTQLSIYLKPGSAKGSQPIEGILYADNNGKPGSLIATTNPLTYTDESATKWYSLAFATPPTITPGNYWIGAITGSSANVIGYCYDNGASNANAYNNDSYSDGPSNPFGTPSWDSKLRSLYASYTVPSSGGSPSAALTANPTTITSGQSSTLTWSSTNTTSCNAPWTGSTATSGNQSVTPSGSGTVNYLIVCSGSGGTVTAQTTITVQAPNPPPNPTPTPTPIPTPTPTPTPSPSPTSQGPTPMPNPQPSSGTTTPSPGTNTPGSHKVSSSRKTGKSALQTIVGFLFGVVVLLAGLILALLLLFLLLAFVRRHRNRYQIDDEDIHESEAALLPQPVDPTVAGLFPFL